MDSIDDPISWSSTLSPPREEEMKIHKDLTRIVLVVVLLLVVVRKCVSIWFTDWRERMVQRWSL